MKLVRDAITAGILNDLVGLQIEIGMGRMVQEFVTNINLQGGAIYYIALEWSGDSIAIGGGGVRERERRQEFWFSDNFYRALGVMSTFVSSLLTKLIVSVLTRRWARKRQGELLGGCVLY